VVRHPGRRGGALLHGNLQGLQPRPGAAVHERVVECADQAEIDYYWDRLTDGGQGVACGWLVDKYGLSWQVVPTRFLDMVTSGDQEKAARAQAAMLTMQKFDIAALERAYAGTA
jgi:predicted 3-demethylubiquinone-9 3-methyltransferase (glyoxalase superfamily)